MHPRITRKPGILPLALLVAGATARSASAAPTFQELGDLEGGGFGSYVSAISANGGVAVGGGSAPTGLEPFRWTQAGGIQALGNLSSGSFGGSEAFGVSGDGSTVVGMGPNGTSYVAFIWDEGHGMRELAQILSDELGLDLSSWTLNRATDISADGTLIVGWGTNPKGDTESWIAVIPEPSTGWLVAAGLAGLACLRRARRS